MKQNRNKNAERRGKTTQNGAKAPTVSTGIEPERGDMDLNGQRQTVNGDTATAAPIMPKLYGDSAVFAIGGASGRIQAAELPVTDRTVQKATETLLKYKSGKSALEKRIIASEDFWKLRQWGRSYDESKRGTPATAWLWNVIVSKHADAMDALPEPNILPKEEDDKAEAKVLTSIVPVVMAQNGFKNVYSNNMWDKLKQGTGVYGIFWDSKKLNGLGDIALRKIDILNCFWEPGAEDIQNSRNFFTVELRDKDLILSEYPDKAEELKRGMKGSNLTVNKYHYDDAIDTSDKAVIVDWYYKRIDEYGRTVLHYCKYVGDVVLFATENEPESYPNGLYEHGRYPFVFDKLYPIKGSPCGYGYTEICKDDQIQIDELSAALVTNAKMASRTRYFTKMNGGINEDEFADWSNDIVHVEGSLDDEHVRQISVPLLNGNFYNLLEWKVNEIKETSGNRDVNNGSTSASVTAASAIAALQEASGKTSRDFLKTTYDSYEQIVKLVIELIRQFYTEERKFRVIGAGGAIEFVRYQNESLQRQQQAIILPDGTAVPGAQVYERLPDFDIEVSAQKNVAYTKAAQNELALQFYGAGFFAPQNADQALAAVDMMDFSHKDSVIQKISENRTIYEQLQQYMQLSIMLAQKYEPALAAKLINANMGEQSGGAVSAGNVKLTADDGAESSITANARAKTQESTQI